MRSRPALSSAPRATALATQVLVADRLEDREAGRAGDRVPAVGRAVGAPAPAFLERRVDETIADSGRPLAMALARTTTSGTIPACSNAHIRPVRPKPDWTSSAMSRMPCSSQNARSSAQEGRRRRVEAALALDRLDEDGARPLRGDDRREQRAQDPPAQAVVAAASSPSKSRYGVGNGAK